MELVYSYSFPEAATFYMTKNDKEGKTLMNRMKALEAFPPNNNESLAGDFSEYAHADQKYRQLNFADKKTKLVRGKLILKHHKTIIKHIYH